jgi:hypothetical protein
MDDNLSQSCLGDTDGLCDDECDIDAVVQNNDQVSIIDLRWCLTHLMRVSTLNNQLSLLRILQHASRENDIRDAFMTIVTNIEKKMTGECQYRELADICNCDDRDSCIWCYFMKYVVSAIYVSNRYKTSATELTTACVESTDIHKLIACIYCRAVRSLPDGCVNNTIRESINVQFVRATRTNIDDILSVMRLMDTCCRIYADNVGMSRDIIRAKLRDALNTR